MADESTLQHPSHEHPLELWEWTFFTRNCDLCRRDIPSEAYACHKGCKTYYHRACAEAPPRIDSHPLHPLHPLTLHHGLPPFRCSECGEFFKYSGSSFRCVDCDFDIDISCALSTLSVRGSSQGEVPERITVPIHPNHPLTSFSTKHNFVRSDFCFICRSIVERDGGYTCLVRGCAFQIHKRCIPDMCYADGANAPQVYHRHPLEVLVGDDTKPARCVYCGSNGSGEFIGCANCQVFYHRDCIQAPDILRYPPHHPHHSLVLFINVPCNVHRECESCSGQIGAELCYCCLSCEFFVHISCALQTVAYCEEGMSAELKWTWHEHPLLLCHKAESGSSHCSCCGDELTGATYKCNTRGCEFLLHERCIGIQPTMVHPYHPDQLSLCAKADGPPPPCRACCGEVSGINYSCKLCAFYIHVKCATRVPNRKHYLHEHNLLRFDEIPSLECNRCGSSTDSPVFRCFLCNFNLHERCLELPRVVNNSTIHWHSLILHETFVEDDSGEYYCDHCESRRDERLGVYMCEQCIISIPRTYHIECVIPELGKVFEKGQASDVKRLDEQIARTAEKVREDERKLEEAKQELDRLKQKLDELRKQRAELTPGQEKNSAAATEEANSQGFVSFSV